MFSGDDAVAMAVGAESRERTDKVASAGCGGAVAVATGVIHCCAGIEADE